MIERAIFSIKEGLRYRTQLKAIPYAKNICMIDWQNLYQSGIRVVVLDFDGVLAADKQEEVLDGVDTVLDAVVSIFGEHVYIFSNQPRKIRQIYFEKNFPRIQFLIAKKKPYPDGLLNIIAREQIDPQQVVLVDDRVLTGGLAAVLAGIKCILIKKPYICFRHNFLREIIFMSIRIVERTLFR